MSATISHDAVLMLVHCCVLRQGRYGSGQHPLWASSGLLMAILSEDVAEVEQEEGTGDPCTTGSCCTLNHPLLELSSCIMPHSYQLLM